MAMLQAHRTTPVDDHVVLLDRHGVPTGAAPKAGLHTAATPLHLGFSCYLVRDDRRVLLTRRAATKSTWPGTWSNSCCGHPRLDETLRSAVTRRVREELGADAADLEVILADFTYRAEMPDGTVEHEVCPVLAAEVGDVHPDPSEVDGCTWVTWDELVARARCAPDTLSPWCVEQVHRLHDLGVDPTTRTRRGNPWSPALDTPLVVGGPLVEGGTPAPAMPDREPVDPFAPVVAPLEDVLARHLDAKVEALRAIDPLLADVAREIGGLMHAGGKRLRPAFVYWGHRATGRPADPGVLVPAAAVEVLHTFALLHDDVMDRSDRRRGRPSAQVAFQDQHAGEGLTGDGAWFGVAAAILAGDLAYLWADELFDATPLDAAAVARAREVFSTLRAEVIAGQYLDLRLAVDTRAEEGWARTVALLKSARYTVTRPLELGLALAGSASPDLEDALRRFGDATGVAFQMRDDVLGLFGDPAVTGKGATDDLREGKRTVLVLRALRLADETSRRLLQGALGDPELDDATADRCREVIASSGALASVEALIRSEHAVAEASLERVPDPARSALWSLARQAIERRA